MWTSSCGNGIAIPAWSRCILTARIVSCLTCRKSSFLAHTRTDQLTAEWGYFRGMDGLPSEYGGPRPDVQGGPVLCDWMVELGYAIMEGN